MKWRLFTIIAIAILVLVGCQGMDNQDEGRQGDGVEPTRFDNNQVHPERTRNDGQNFNNQNNTRDNNRGNMRNDDRNKMSNNGNNEYDVAEEAADKITSEVNEVESAYVLTTENNAYVAVVIDQDNNDNKGAKKDQNNMTNDRRGKADNERSQTRNVRNSKNDGGDDEVADELKQQISDVVQSVDDNIDNVYVSTNPDFVDLTNNYVNDVNAGNPIRGMFDQIGNMVERIFPQNR